jgi:hypothetical protein
VDYDHGPEAFPLSLHTQVGVSALPTCSRFWNSYPWIIDCGIDETLEEELQVRNVGPAKYPYHSTGRYITWRLYVSDTKQADQLSVDEIVYDYAPIGGNVNFNRVEMNLEPVGRC